MPVTFSKCEGRAMEIAMAARARKVAGSIRWRPEGVDGAKRIASI